MVEHTHRRNHHVLVTNTTTAIPTVSNPPGQRHPPHPSCPLARVHNARIDGIAVDYVLRARGRHGRGGGNDAQDTWEDLCGGAGQALGKGMGNTMKEAGGRNKERKNDYFREVSAVISSPNPFANGRITAFQLLQPPISSYRDRS